MRTNLDRIATAAPLTLVPGGFKANRDQNHERTTPTASTAIEAARGARRKETAIVTTTSVAADKGRRRHPGQGAAREPNRASERRRTETRPEDKSLDAGPHRRRRQQHHQSNLAQYSSGASGNREKGEGQMDELTMRRIRETVSKFMGVPPLLSSAPASMKALSVAGPVIGVDHVSSNRESARECNLQSTTTTKLATTSFITTTTTTNNNNHNHNHNHNHSNNMNGNATAQLGPADLSAAGPFGPTPATAQSNHFQFGSPIVGGTSTDSALESMMAAVAARYRQHDQHQALLSQFASLHSLSAVASAIQNQSISSLQHTQQRKQTRARLQASGQTQSQTTAGLGEYGRSNQQLGAQAHHFALDQHNQRPLHPIGAELAYLSQQFNLSGQLAQQIGSPQQQQQQEANADNRLSSDPAEQYQQNVQLLGAQLQFGHSLRHPLAAEAHIRLIDNDNQMATRMKTARSAAAKPTTTTTPTGEPRSRKRRRGSRKCRKVYGMAQRQMWCTQCKWKKACSRFAAQQQQQQQQKYPSEQQQVTTTTGTGASAGNVARRFAANCNGKHRQSSAEARSQKLQVGQANNISDSHQRLDVSWPVSIV